MLTQAYAPFRKSDGQIMNDIQLRSYRKLSFLENVAAAFGGSADDYCLCKLPTNFWEQMTTQMGAGNILDVANCTYCCETCVLTLNWKANGG